LFYQQLLILFAGIAAIIVLTGRLKFHPFFALVLVSLIIGLLSGSGFLDVIGTMKDGFGHIMRSLGFIIVLGTTLGLLLERSESTFVLADFILKKVGVRRSPLAMNLTGLFVGLPIFCDSGFIVLSGLTRSIARQSGVSIVILATSLATGLYAVHCLIPPHPGASSATALFNSDFGRVILMGIVVAIPAAIAGYFWALFAGKKFGEAIHSEVQTDVDADSERPGIVGSALPIIVPIGLIALASFIDKKNSDAWAMILRVLGEPSIALTSGVIIALFFLRKQQVSKTVWEAVEKSGSILVIIGAGGAFGAVLASTQIAEGLGQNLPLESMGLLFPFLVTALLKTAQGSSTVAIITASTIMLPLVSPLGLDSENGKIVCILAMGSGSMLVSHANDAYFWVISNFQKIPMQTMLKVYSTASIIMGLVAFAGVYLLSVIIL
jgi:gluconate:H+ symporter, GntP family